MATITDEDYATHVETLLAELGRMHAQGQDIDPAMCVSGLEPRRDHKKVRDFVVKQLKLMKAAEFDRAIQREAVKAEFHGYPSTPRDFVEQMARKLNLSVSYKGLMFKRETPYIICPFTGQREYFTPDLLAMPEFTGIVAKFHCHLNIDDLMLRVRAEARQWELGFAAADLNDATRLWFQQSCQDRLQAIIDAVAYSGAHEAQKRAQASLWKLADTCFDCNQDADFVVAVINKFIWQVKHKMIGLPVTDHLMVVILGGQGIGKSTLVNKLLAPIAEAWAMTDFRAISDDRNVTLWNNFALFLDEMGGAKKAEMDIVKKGSPADLFKIVRERAFQIELAFGISAERGF